MRKLLKDFVAGDWVKAGRVARCPSCRVLFIGRKDALFCSNACQMVVHRERVGGKAADAEVKLGMIG